MHPPALLEEFLRTLMTGSTCPLCQLGINRSLAIAAGVATIDYIKRENLLDRVQKLGEKSKSEFKRIARRAEGKEAENRSRDFALADVASNFIDKIPPDMELELFEMFPKLESRRLAVKVLESVRQNPAVDQGDLAEKLAVTTVLSLGCFQD